MSDSLRVSAPSRLHFGMLRFAREEGRSFGGLGMMVDQPRVVVELSKAESWSGEGCQVERALQVAQQVVKGLDLNSAQPLQVKVVEVPQAHSGLGTGTQLALGVALGVDHLLGSGTAGFEDLVGAAQRGRRGAVGSYGFHLGGLIWELGKLPEYTLGELKQRIPVPDPWRVVQIRLAKDEGLSGKEEQEAFGRLPAVPNSVTAELIRLAEEQILPAAEQSDFELFSSSTYEYGVRAGNCFASVQGGPFASAQIAELVERVRSFGVLGVGQSSWGPTVFAFTENSCDAENLVEQLRSETEQALADIRIAKPNNQGARIEHIAQDSEQPVAY